MGLTLCRTARDETRHIVLPNSKLIGCKGPDCAQLWQETPTEGASIYPHNVNIDIEDDAILGIVAHYEKSVSIDELRAKINDRYGKWIYIDRKDSPVKVWRVDPEKISIQLSTEDNGIKEVIYLSARAWDKKH